MDHPVTGHPAARPGHTISGLLTAGVLLATGLIATGLIATGLPPGTAHASTAHASTTHAGPAGVSPSVRPRRASRGVIKEHGLAGYHATTHGSSVTVRGKITVPRASCGRGAFAYAPEIVARYYVGHGLKLASVSLSLACDLGVPVYGDASLSVNGRTKVVSHPLRAGQTVAITIAITRSRTTVTIAYSARSSASLRGAGGRPYDAQYLVALVRPPSYRPVRFSACTVSRRDLSALHPGAWESVTKSGKVDGKVSRITKGTTFTVSR
jgi:hypothetical protein